MVRHQLHRRVQGGLLLLCLRTPHVLVGLPGARQALQSGSFAGHDQHMLGPRRVSTRHRRPQFVLLGWRRRRHQQGRMVELHVELGCMVWGSLARLRVVYRSSWRPPQSFVGGRIRMEWHSYHRRLGHSPQTRSTCLRSVVRRLPGRFKLDMLCGERYAIGFSRTDGVSDTCGTLGTYLRRSMVRFYAHRAHPEFIHRHVAGWFLHLRVRLQWDLCGRRP
mmetsp:Transcript_133596/g.427019  ORF Transcript_133596/g.427019 Transcript_133596/m.427019 type:complete len:220 (+) Transcript_133596:830-1489(+)